MNLHENNRFLVETLEAISLLDNRYTDIQFVNYDSVNDQKRGCFSLVFRAYDTLHQKKVALKFYDIEPQRMLDIYRIKAFRREHEILQTLINKNRCLQLASDLSTFELSFPQTNGKNISMPCSYFAVEWIDHDIDDFFLGNGACTPIQKLRLFNEIVLAVESLHRYEIFHRDIKADNLRFYQKALERIVVAIDLGTAARFTSGWMNNNYGASVGAPGYASPEALCGLAGHRLIARYTDNYALGCLLYELFNKDYFYRELLRCNPSYVLKMSAMATYVMGVDNEKDQLIKWKEAVKQLGSGVTEITIETVGSSVPTGIVVILNEILAGLTHINYSKRPTLEWTRLKILSAIKVLENAESYRRKLELAKSYRAKREDKIARAQARLIRSQEAKKLC